MMRTRPTTLSLRLGIGCLAAHLGGCATQSQAVLPEPPAQVASAPAAPSAPAPEAKAQPAPIPQGPLSFEPVYYGLDSALLSDEAQGRLRGVAEALRGRPEASLTISGHTCELGTSEYNAQLGSRRAEQARAYLVKLGIAPERLHTVSFGEERPALTGQGEAVWSKNRRSEFSLDAQQARLP